MCETRYTCPCCGYRTFDELPGSYEISSVCYWEDEPVQLLNPAYAGGANEPSLVQCQENYAQFNASEERFVGSVRPPHDDEPRDPEWRPATTTDLSRAHEPRVLTDEEYHQLETWYYWKRQVAPPAFSSLPDRT